MDLTHHWARLAAYECRRMARHDFGVYWHRPVLVVVGQETHLAQTPGDTGAPFVLRVPEHVEALPVGLRERVVKRTFLDALGFD